MCLLDRDFYTEYDLSFSAWGEGVLREDGLLEMQKPDEAIKEFKKKKRRYPKSISFLVRDPRSVGYKFGFTSVDPALLEKLRPYAKKHPQVWEPLVKVLENAK